MTLQEFKQHIDSFPADHVFRSKVKVRRVNHDITFKLIKEKTNKSDILRVISVIREEWNHRKIDFTYDHFNYYLFRNLIIQLDPEAEDAARDVVEKAFI